MEKIDAQEATEVEEDECTVQRVQGTNAEVRSVSILHKRKLPKAVKPYFWQFRLPRLVQVAH